MAIFVACLSLRVKYVIMETLNTIIGGFLAGGLGLGAFFVQEYYSKKKEKRKVANALSNEMLHTLKFLAAGYITLIRISKKSGSVTVSEISQAYPSRRAVYVTLGHNIGALSEKAAEDAVNFDHYMQALERDFNVLAGGDSRDSVIDPEIALKLANKVFSVIGLTTGLVKRMANEVGDTHAEATKNSIQKLETFVESQASD